LPEYLRKTSLIVSPQPEHYKQVILYLWSLVKQGVDVDCGNIIYFNRDTGEMREALVPWNEMTQYDAEQLIEQIKAAKVLIDRGELPKPTVESHYVCASFCPYRIQCEYGRSDAADHQKKVARTRRPAWVKKQAEQQREGRERVFAELQVTQPGLGIEISEPEAKKKKTPKCKSVPAETQVNNEPPRCGEYGCGLPMVCNGKKGKQRRWVCPEHPSS
jgi:hypothetical protein